MDKLRWCRQQKKGIRLIAPGKNVQGAYIIKAEEALDALKTSRTKSWKIIGAYYAIYNSAYSLLMGIGIKCEIHSCTIEIIKEFLKEYFTFQDIDLI